jgi:hypothetical protein
MDVEGGELNVLRGAHQLLTREPRPVFLCELSDRRTAWWGFPASEIYRHFKGLDFRLYSVLPSGELSPSPLRERYDENLVAVPLERGDYLGDKVTLSGSRVVS